jgi:hypothetical protein
VDCSKGYPVDGVWDFSIFSIWLGVVFASLFLEGEREKENA